MPVWYLENPGPNMGIWEVYRRWAGERLRIIVSPSILVRASTTVPSASCPAARRRYQRPAPSNPWNHRGAATSSICPRRYSSLGAPPRCRLWDRRNGGMRSLRVKRRYCAVKGLVPAGRSSRSRLFRRVLLRRVAVRGRSNGLILPSKFACCGNVSFDVPIASPSFVVPHPTPAPHGAEMA